MDHTILLLCVVFNPANSAVAAAAQMLELLCYLHGCKLFIKINDKILKLIYTDISNSQLWKTYSFKTIICNNLELCGVS